MWHVVIQLSPKGEPTEHVSELPYGREACKNVCGRQDYHMLPPMSLIMRLKGYSTPTGQCEYEGNSHVPLE